MIKEKKTFDFMGVFKVEIQMRDDSPEGFRDEALGGVYNECFRDKDDNYIFKVWFKNLPVSVAITHECWHLFCMMMAYIDSAEHCWGSLNSEIYAYNFHMLHCNLVENLTSMKWYKKLWDERQKKCN